MSKHKTDFLELGTAVHKALSKYPEAQRGLDYLDARGWTTATIKAVHFRWADADDLRGIWSKKLKGLPVVGGLVLPFPNDRYYASVRVFYEDGTPERDKSGDEDDTDDDDSVADSVIEKSNKKGKPKELKPDKFLVPFGPLKFFLPSFKDKRPLDAFVESPFKAALATTKGFKVIGVIGCWGCKVKDAQLPSVLLNPPPTKEDATAYFRQEVLKYIVKGKPVEFWTDADVLTNLGVRKAQLGFLDAAKALGAEAVHRPIPEGGIDDYLVSHSPADVRKLPVYKPDSQYVDVLRNPFRDLTEFGVADRFVAIHGKDLRYDPVLHPAGWFAWNGERWLKGEAAKKDANIGVRATIGTLKDEAAAEKNPGTQEWRHDKALYFQAQARVKAVLTLIETSSQAIRIDATKFDADPGFLGVQNGVLDIRDPAKPVLVQKDRSLLVSQFANVAFDPQAKAPMWEKFVADVTGNDKERMRLVHEVFGAGLRGKSDRKEIILLVGPTKTGKTVLLETMYGVLGDYAVATKADIFLREDQRGKDSQRPEPFTMELRGKRLGACSELPEGVPFDDAKLKDLTGGDTRSARGLYGSVVEFKITVLLVVRANQMPLVVSTSDAVWTRLIVVLFDKVIPEKDQDDDLCSKLVKTEASGILNHALAGMASYAARGRRFAIPKDMMALLERHRKNSDVLGNWLDENWIVDKAKPKYKALQSHVTHDYTTWCKENNHQPMSSKTLWEKIRERFKYIGDEPLVPVQGRQYAKGWLEKRKSASPPYNAIMTKDEAPDTSAKSSDYVVLNFQTPKKRKF